jgi:hypothetical protein
MIVDFIPPVKKSFRCAINNINIVLGTQNVNIIIEFLSSWSFHFLFGPFGRVVYTKPPQPQIQQHAVLYR